MPATAKAQKKSLEQTVWQLERQLIELALKAAGGNMSQAARALHEDRPNLYRRMRRLGISLYQKGRRNAP